MATGSSRGFLPLLAMLLWLSLGRGEKGSRCEEISIPMCRGIGYNLTSMPNQFNHDTQEEAGLEVHQFWPLVEIQCSSDLKFFLCSMYAPICIEDYHQPLPACRSVCERAKAGCAPLMRQYGFAWPERMNCDKLPLYGDQHHLCMDAKNGSGPEEQATLSPFPSVRAQPPATRRPIGTGKGKMHCAPGRDTGHCRDAEKDNCTCRCRHPLVNITSANPLYNQSISVGGVDNCGLPCEGPYFFQGDEKEFAQWWITLWSSLCCVSTLMTLTTYLIDMERFKYPERPIVFLSACYFMVSVGYLIRVVLGPQAIACDEGMIRYNYNGPTICTAVFLLLYFFGMASSIWWVVLALTWFLAAGLKWGNEAIAGYSQYFHIAAWFIPLVKAVAVLVMSSVDGDPVAGVCYVGNQNVDNLRGFVLAPLVVYLLLGTTFLLMGFVSLFRIRNVIKQQGRTKADKLEKLMIRIGIFSVLYTVPATIVIACYIYESQLHHVWMRPLVCRCMEQQKPVYSILMLKYFMALAVGITSGVWIWSGKTLESWKRFYQRLTGKPTYQPQHRTLKHVNYPATSVPSHVGSAPKQPPLSHV